MTRTTPLTLALLVAALLAPSPALAHWCNNIWAAPSRIVVKPEVTTLYVGTTSASKLRVYIQNNLPYKLFSVEMQGAASGFSIQVAPAFQDINPGQNVSFVFTIQKSSGSGGTVAVSTLNMQMRFRPNEWPYGWNTESNNCMLNQSVTKSDLVDHASGWMHYSSTCGMSNQAGALNAGTLAGSYPTEPLKTQAPYLGHTGAEQLIKWFGYHFCWNASGGYRCGSQDCPSPCAEGSAWNATDQFGQNCMRAGAELGARRAQLGSHLAAAQAGATNALKGAGASSQHKCMAAVVGAHLLKGSGSTAAFLSELQNASNAVPQNCQNAALRILNGTPASTCAAISTSAYFEKAACAAAEGLSGNDAVVKAILMDRAGDGAQPYGGDYQSLYYAYMLYIVTSARKAQYGSVSYYPDAGAPFAAGDLKPAPDQKPAPDKKITADQKPGVDQKPGLDKKIVFDQKTGFDQKAGVDQKQGIDSKHQNDQKMGTDTKSGLDQIPAQKDGPIASGDGKTPDEGGCDCRLSPDGQGSGGLSLLLVTALMLLGLKRRRSRSGRR